MNERFSSRDAILDAAERVFAASGFDGATMREIAGESGISQALLHYHFQNKENLYEEIIARRARVINGYRSQRIDELFAADATPTLEAVLDVLFCPASNAVGRSGQPDAFTQVVSGIIVSNDQRSRDLMIKHYDPIARKFVEAFLKLQEPKLTHEDAVWAYLFAHSIRMQVYAHTGRPERLLGKPLTETGRRKAIGRALKFASAGIRALSRI